MLECWITRFMLTLSATSASHKFQMTAPLSCPSVIINNLLTLIGGFYNEIITNQLFSLTREGSDRRWNSEEFPPMPTEQWGSSALC